MNRQFFRNIRDEIRTGLREGYLGIPLVMGVTPIVYIVVIWVVSIVDPSLLQNATP